MFRALRRSVKKTFPDTIRRGKAIDFLATVGMSTDGIAYNHYNIKYVLKRLGDQSSSKGSTHMEGGENKEVETGEREGESASHTHSWKDK